jgi:hypothetical protein
MPFKPSDLTKLATKTFAFLSSAPPLHKTMFAVVLILLIAFEHRRAYGYSWPLLVLSRKS